MKVFITGGTGFIGTYLVKRLLQTRHQLVCLARKTSDTSFLEEAGADLLIGDVTDKFSLLKGMDGCDCVLHLASSFVFWFPDNRVYHHVNVKGTQNVMESVLEKGVSKVVYVSTGAVWGKARGIITENTPVGRKRASKYVRTMEKENNLGEKYLVSAENHTWGEFNQMISDISGTKLPVLKFPTWLTMMNAYLLTGIANLIKKPPLWDMSIDQMNLSRQNFNVDGSKAERELGIQYTSIHEGLKDAIRSFQ